VALRGSEGVGGSPYGVSLLENNAYII